MPLNGLVVLGRYSRLVICNANAMRRIEKEEKLPQKDSMQVYKLHYNAHCSLTLLKVVHVDVVFLVIATPSRLAAHLSHRPPKHSALFVLVALKALGTWLRLTITSQLMFAGLVRRQAVKTSAYSLRSTELFGLKSYSQVNSTLTYHKSSRMSDDWKNKKSLFDFTATDIDGNTVSSYHVGI